MRALVFGEILWDVYPDKEYIGGAPLNFAAHFAKHGGKAYMLSAVGNDTLGDRALEKLSSWKVNTDYVKALEAETGKCLVTLDENSVPAYNLLTDVAWDYIDTKVDEKFDVLYFGTLALRSETNIKTLNFLIANGEFKEIFCDMNIRPPFYNETSVRMVFEYATILKISDEELERSADCIGISAKSIEDYSRKIKETFPNIKLILTTLGAKGSMAFDGERFYYAKGLEVELASTVGAGDSFSAAFLYKYILGEGIETCLSHATKVSALVVSKYDAVPEYNPDLL